MAQIAPIASLVTGVAGVIGSTQQARNQSQQRADTTAADAARQQQVQLAAAEQARLRDETVRRTIASARARMAAGGVSVNEGSSAAVIGGIEDEARRRQEADDQTLEYRIASGRRSLLDTDGSVTPFIRYGAQIGTGLSSSFRSLLNL